MPQPPASKRHAIGLVLALAAGCGDDTVPTAPQPAQQAARATPPLGGDAERTYEFGSVIGGRNVQFDHIYTIKNQSPKAVSLLRGVNGKPCCGEIRFEPTALEPGATSTLTVTLRVGQTVGPISHFAVVETDAPDAAALEFRTTANALPQVRIEEVGDARPRLYPGMKAPIHLMAFSYGTRDTPPLPLDETERM